VPEVVAPADRLLEEVGVSLSRYAQQIDGVQEFDTTALLTALALAEAPGFPAELWSAAVGALNPGKPPPTPARLREFAAAPGAELVTSVLAESGRDQEVCYRLFHQTLGDALLRARPHRAAPGSGTRQEPDPDQRALSLALIRSGRAAGWASVPGYSLRSLPGHAILGDTVDDLLAEADYLLYADLHRLSVAADRATSEAARKRAELLRKTRGAHLADPPTRAAMFSVTEAQERLGGVFGRPRPPAPYRAAWASVLPQEVEVDLNAHEHGVSSACSLTDEFGGTVLATGGEDGAVKLWGETSVAPLLVLSEHEGAVNALCVLRAEDGRALLVSGGQDHTVRVWDPREQRRIALMTGHGDAVTAVCEVPGRAGTGGLVATGSLDGTVRLWNPATGKQRTLPGQNGEVASLCLLPGDGAHGAILAGGGFDGLVRLWDVSSRRSKRALTGNGHHPRAMCALRDARGTARLLAVGGSDGYCRIYDFAQEPPRFIRMLPHNADISTLCAVPTRTGEDLLAVADGSRTVSVWNPLTGRLVNKLVEPSEWVQAICPVSTSGGRVLLALGARRTGSLRLWDPAANSANRLAPARGTTPRGRVPALCEVPATGARTRGLLATIGSDPVARLLDPGTGDSIRSLEECEHLRVGKAVCSVPDLGGQRILALGGEGHNIVLWNTLTGDQKTLRADGDSVDALCALVDDAQRVLVASAGENHEIQLWDPDRRARLRRLRCGEGGAAALCVVPKSRLGRPGLENDAFLAAGGEDGAIYLWHVRNWRAARRIPAHDKPITALCVLPESGTGRMLVSCSADGSVRVWDVDTGEQAFATLQGHRGSVDALCVLAQATGPAAGRTMLVSGGDDRIVRFWDLESDLPVLEIPVRHRVLSLAAIGGMVHVGLTAGVTALEVLGLYP
jgi:WD40 repeat protein